MTRTAAPVPPFERALSRLMMAGVWISSALLAAGLASQLLSPGSPAADPLLRAGLVLMMATPVLRVVLSMAEAVRQRDWFWLWTTVAVVLILAGTVAYSLHGV